MPHCTPRNNRCHTSTNKRGHALQVSACGFLLCLTAVGIWCSELTPAMHCAADLAFTTYGVDTASVAKKIRRPSVCLWICWGGREEGEVGLHADHVCESFSTKLGTVRVMCWCGCLEVLTILPNMF